MQGAILILGSIFATSEEKIEYALKNNISAKNNPDLLIVSTPLDKKHIGIDQIREAIVFLTQKPFCHPRKTVIITEAEKMTTESQNALLKTLEEPPKYADIILFAKTENALLPTIISRCQKLQLNSKRTTKTQKKGEETQQNLQDNKAKTITQLKTLSKGERLAYAEELGKEEREDIIELLENWIFQEREGLKAASQQAKLSLEDIENLSKIKEDLEKTNVNLKLALEYLFLILL